MMEVWMVVCLWEILYELLLVVQDCFGVCKFCVEDINFQLDIYCKLLIKILFVVCILEKYSQLGEKIGLMLFNVGISVVVIFGVIVCGCILVMMNYIVGVKGFSSVIVVVEFNIIFILCIFFDKGKFWYLLEQLIQVCWVFLEDFKGDIIFVDKLWIFVYLLVLCLVQVKQQLEDVVMIFFIFGFEGNLKGVVYSYKSLLFNVEQIKIIVDFIVNDCFMLVLLLFYFFGFIVGLLMLLFIGVEVFFYFSLLYYCVVLELVYDCNCMVLFGILIFFVNYVCFVNLYDFYCLCYVVVGVEKLQESIKQLWQDKFGLCIFEGYGVIECVFVVLINVLMVVKVGIVGCILLGMDVCLLVMSGID